VAHTDLELVGLVLLWILDAWNLVLSDLIYELDLAAGLRLASVHVRMPGIER
jgi:hypothetical protein